MLKVLPDVLYSQEEDGEIAIEWSPFKEQLTMLTFIDLNHLYPQMKQFATDLVAQMQSTSHPNLLNLTETVYIIDQIQTIVFKTESPDHISGWKQFCKSEFGTKTLLSQFRQLTSAIAHLNSCGIIHRDVHPTRLHIANGILKFNMIGLPYNFKKLLKRQNFSGHVNYSAPEFITDQ